MRWPIRSHMTNRAITGQENRALPSTSLCSLRSPCCYRAELRSGATVLPAPRLGPPGKNKDITQDPASATPPGPPFTLTKLVKSWYLPAYPEMGIRVASRRVRNQLPWRMMKSVCWFVFWNSFTEIEVAHLKLCNPRALGWLSR